jgi:hypothetical protein
MKKALVVVALCTLVFVLFIHAQSSGSGSFSGTVGGQPFNGTFTTSTTDPCSSSAVAKSSVAVSSSAVQVLVTTSGTTAIYVCGFGLDRDGGGANFSYGTAAQCTSSASTPLTGNLLTSTDTAPFIAGNQNQTVLFVPVGNDLCGSGSGFVTYVQR